MRPVGQAWPESDTGLAKTPGGPQAIILDEPFGDTFNLRNPNKDQRKPLKNPDSFPGASICRITAFDKYPNQSRSKSATGWLIDPRTVVTAGHALFDKAVFTEYWANSVRVHFGTKVQETAIGLFVEVHANYEKFQNIDYDFGIIRLDRDIKRKPLPLLGESAYDLFRTNINVVGFSRDRPELVTHSGETLKLNATKRRFHYLVDTNEGQSGSPVIVDWETGTLAVVGIHTRGYDGNDSTNSAIWLKDDVRKWLKDKAGLSLPAASVVPGDREIEIRRDLPLWPQLRDGRYRGGNDKIVIDLRVDIGELDIISGDIFDKDSHYLASFKTISGDSSYQAAFRCVEMEDRQGRSARGRLRLHSVKENLLIGELRLEAAVSGLSTQDEVHFIAEHRCDLFRELNLHVLKEDGTPSLQTYTHGNSEVSLSTCFSEAGVDLRESLAPLQIPNSPAQRGWGVPQLATLLNDLAGQSLTKADWSLYLLWLQRSTREGLLGVMFDEDHFPRQGSAIFANEVLSYSTDSTFARNLIQTAIHEIGHALNLVHRFEPEVGRCDSNSFMNYDWRFKGGGRSEEYWKHFDFKFDRDEIEFLRHAFKLDIIPGGRRFSSKDYWSNPHHSAPRTLYESEPLNRQLSLKLMGTRQKMLAFGQSVFLTVQLTNIGNQPIRIPSWILDSKSGLLDLHITRKSGFKGTVHPVQFRPVFTRCRFANQDHSLILLPGESHLDNVNLSYGKEGFYFAEPGAYEVQASLCLPDARRRTNDTCLSEPIQIHVARPYSLEEEEEAAELMDPKIGLYLALGGIRTSEAAKDRLEELIEKRQSDKGMNPRIAAAIRALAIDEGRWYLRYHKEQFVTIEGQRSRAAELLGYLKPENGLQFFDPQTRTTTSSLMKKHQSAMIPRKAKK